MASASQPGNLPYDVGTSVAGAIIEHPRLGFLLQLRDEFAPSYPLHWTLFGGHMEADESPTTALWRELAEELRLGPEQVTRWQFVQRNPRSYGGHQFIFHVVTAATTDDLVLGEGKAMRYVTQMQIADAIAAGSTANGGDPAVAPLSAVALLGHDFAANVAMIFCDHFAGRRDKLDGVSD